jgi:hypothetical protein
MKARKYNLFQRVLVKANAVVYTAVGRFTDALVKSGLWGAVKFSISGHFGDVIHVEHAYPKNFRAQDKPYFDEWKSYDTFPHDLFFVEDAWVTSDGIVLQKNKTFVKTLPHPVFRHRYGFLYNLKARLLYKKIKSDPAKNYLLVYDNWSFNNYFHWVIDSLCRLELLRENEETIPKEFTLVLRADAPQYIRDAVKLFGYNAVFYLPPKSGTRIKNLYSMNYAAWSGQQHPEVLKRMVKFICKTLDAEAETPSRKIYVSRSRQFSRRVENEQEILVILERYGFEIIFYEGKSFMEQVKLMRNVSHFVTSHGANMTNTIFLPGSARVLELLNDKKPNFCYWSVNACMGHSYFYQLCPLGAADHIRVDTAELERNLRAILA